MPGELEGRSALVTGGGGGIGAAVAIELARRGARVVVIGRTELPLRRVVERIHRLGGRADHVVGDVGDAATASLIRDVEAEIDVLVAAAASYAPYRRFDLVANQDWADVLRTGIEGTRRTIQAVLPGMVERGFGRIVVIGSAAGSRGGSGQGPYATSKAALIGLTRTVAVESARSGVTANVVEPGLIETARVAQAIDDATRRRILASVPMGRIGTPEEVAHVVTFLASPAAGYVTGAVLPVSGGLGLGLTTVDDR